MREVLAQPAGIAWVIACAAALLALALLLVVLRRRQKRATSTEGPHSQPSAPGSADASGMRDSAAILAAVRTAEARGQHEKLPILYLSLARCRIETGEVADAEELLRKSIRAAGGAHQKETHARARLALGDLAHAGGDLTTACEHWQIARAIFFELKQRGDHEAVEGRMRRNGCPTDWVLTDF